MISHLVDSIIFMFGTGTRPRNVSQNFIKICQVNSIRRLAEVNLVMGLNGDPHSLLIGDLELNDMMLRDESREFL